MSVNSVTLLGRVGREPETRTVGEKGAKVSTFSLCTGSKYKAQNGRDVDDTAWHNIVAWRNLSDLAEKYVKKGSQLLVIGHLSYREYVDDNGNKRYVTDIVADKIELCGAKIDSTPGNDPYVEGARQMQVEVANKGNDDDLPF